MQLPKLAYDDFYKFLVSLGIILFLVSLGLGVTIVNNLILNFRWIFIILCLLSFISSIIIVILAGRKWYSNQKLLDKKLKAKTKMLEQSASDMIRQPSFEGKGEITERGIQNEINAALITYKIASVLPNTIPFNFLKDWKVWFLIENREKKKYRVYIKIKFISRDYIKELNDGYFGGTKAWNLNALSAIVAPGLGIPEEIKEKAKGGEKIEIRIFCEVKDENDELIEKKLPIGYVYDYKNNNWYYEP